MAETEFIVDKENLEVRVTRYYKTTPERIFQAYTSPEEIVKWWGPRKYQTTVDQMDVRVGGKWRYLHKDQEGNEFAFRGEYLEIDEPNKLVSTFEFEQMAGHIMTDTLTLEDQGDGQTKLHAVSKFSSPEDLEGMVGSGMEGGQRESMDRLSELVEEA